ncbi:MAG TPA: methylated-DNA--[protein]-cysteine S-methyltransferase [Bacillaceae bacterium]
MKEACLFMESPLGELVITGNESGITGIFFGKEPFLKKYPSGLPQSESDPLLTQASMELNEYFSGNRKTFEVPMSYRGTEFQEAVWQELARIPYGTTKTYGEVAKAIKRDKAVRAVGQANRSNRLPILIPCHRVMGANKALTGYAGNLIDKKELLLSLEGAL